MGLDRLTQKARTVILSLSAEEKSTCSAQRILKEIKEAGGMGETLLELYPRIKISKSSKVDVNNLVTGAYYQALKFNQPYVGTEHLFLSLLNLIKSPDLRKVQEKLAEIGVFPQSMEVLAPNRKTPFLNAFGTSLNHRVIRNLAKPLVFREELDSLISVLLQKKNPNPLIVGEPGVGKRSLIELLVRRINDLNVPPTLMGIRVIEFDLLAFITNTFSKGAAEYSITTLFDELRSMERVILSIKDFQNLFFSTNIGVAVPLVYSAFKNGLEAANIRCIATMSDSVYTKLTTDNQHVVDNFSAINLSAPAKKVTINILKASAVSLSDHHNLKISDDLVEYVYEVAKKEIRDEVFPQKGIDLLDQACTKAVISNRKVPVRYRNMIDDSVVLTEGLDKSLELGKYDEALFIKRKIEKLDDKMWVDEKVMFGGKILTLTKTAVDAALEDYGVQVRDLALEDISSLSTLSKRMEQSIIGQSAAVEAVSKGLIRAKLGLRSKKRPLGNFLFLGPTGVGKTELAKVLAKEAFGEDSLIRLDMSDFGEKHNVARLVGAPPGYIGYGDGGELTSKIDINPESVVLFDEIEKAHPDVLNILLQITEEGELVDSKGHTFDFSKSVIVLTSNLGTGIIHNKGIGFDEKILDSANIEKRLKSNLKKILKPELLNRLDEVIVFDRLNKKDQLKVLELLLSEIKETLNSQDIKVRISAKVKKFLLKTGYSDEYGARALRRTVEKELLDKIAEILLDNQARPLKLSTTVKDDAILVKIL
jgi:ATP-dependent Clp protease ATP-binding subunit ClpC